VERERSASADRWNGDRDVPEALGGKTQDGEVVESETLPPGERRTFQGDDEVTLRFYDGGGVRLRAGGRDIGTKGAGSTVEVRLWLDDEGRIQVERTYGV
jgi:hypothetical protein